MSSVRQRVSWWLGRLAYRHSVRARGPLLATTGHSLTNQRSGYALACRPAARTDCRSAVTVASSSRASNVAPFDDPLRSGVAA